MHETARTQSIQHTVQRYIRIISNANNELQMHTKYTCFVFTRQKQYYCIAYSPNVKWTNVISFDFCWRQKKKWCRLHKNFKFFVFLSHCCYTASHGSTCVRSLKWVTDGAPRISISHNKNGKLLFNGSVSFWFLDTKISSSKTVLRLNKADPMGEYHCFITYSWNISIWLIIERYSFFPLWIMSERERASISVWNGKKYFKLKAMKKRLCSVLLSHMITVIRSDNVTLEMKWK